MRTLIALLRMVFSMLRYALECVVSIKLHIAPTVVK